MLLGFVFSILTATYSLSSTTSIEVSGDVPTGSTYTYERSATSGQKGQMTEGNSTRLHLEGWDGCTIHSIDLQMHSNKSSGRGSLQVCVGGEVIWSVVDETFSSPNWAGEYTTKWVNVMKDVQCVVPDAADIDIIISATENSLYIGSYTIKYTEAPVRCYTVDFVTGMDISPAMLTQSAIGAPVVLPAWRDSLDWRFLGWSEEEVLESTLEPAVLSPGALYFPTRNTTLWAVYSDGDKLVSVSDYQSDRYVMMMCNTVTESVLGVGHGMAMLGSVSDGEIALRDVRMMRLDEGGFVLETPVSGDMAYYVDFVSDSTLTIRHVQSNTWVGYKERSLSAVSSLWQYRVLDDGSILVYYMYSNKSYVLYFGSGVNGTNEYMSAYSQPALVDLCAKDGLVLFPAVVLHYTSWPFGKGDGVENVLLQHDGEDRFFRFGIYELHVKDGKKTLNLLHM